MKDVLGNSLTGEYSFSFTTIQNPETIVLNTTASPVSGTYDSTQTVILSCSIPDSCATTFYTLNGSKSTIASSVYAAPVSEEEGTTVLKFFSVDNQGNVEVVNVETYVVNSIIDPTTDSTPPVITLSGNNFVTLNQGDTYTEAGASALDDVDGNISVTRRYKHYRQLHYHLHRNRCCKQYQYRNEDSDSYRISRCDCQRSIYHHEVLYFRLTMFRFTTKACGLRL